ncbi:MAG: acetyltransferase [Pseudomonadota bacterium]
MADVSFRPMRPEDQARVFQVWRRAVQATHHFLAQADFEEISTLVHDQYIPQAPLEVAVVDDRPVGFMGMTDLHVDSLFVDPDAMGQGIGRAFIDRARGRGAPVTVDVNEQNDGAVEFYRRLGFAVVDRSDLDDQGRPYPILNLRDGDPPPN